MYERGRLGKGGERFQNDMCFGSMRREILAEENINYKIAKLFSANFFLSRIHSELIMSVRFY
jgi:hypothetical protein